MFFISSFDTGKKSDDKTHPDFVPSLFSFVKSPEKHRAKRMRQLEKFEVMQNMKAKRLRALSLSDKENVDVSTENLGTENVSTVETDEEFIDRGTQTGTLDVCDKGCQTTEDSTFQDVGCQTKDVEVNSQSNQTEPPADKVDKGVLETQLPFDQDDMKDDKKVKY